MKRKCKAGHLKCIYIYIHVHVFVVLQCKVTTIRLHSGRDNRICPDLVNCRSPSSGSEPSILHGHLDMLMAVCTIVHIHVYI